MPMNLDYIQSLIRRYQDNADSEAGSLLVISNRGMIFRIINRMAPNELFDREDMYQEASVIIVGCAYHWDLERSIKAWPNYVAQSIGKAIKRMIESTRDELERVPLDKELMDTLIPAVTTDLDDTRPTVDLLREMVATLPDWERQVLTARLALDSDSPKLKGCAIEEVASMLGASRLTIETALDTAMALLRGRAIDSGYAA